MSTPPTMEDVYTGTGVEPPSKTHEGEFHNDVHTTPIPITRATKIYALCAAVNSCNLGYDIGVNTNAGWRVQQDFDLTDNVRISMKNMREYTQTKRKLTLLVSLFSKENCL